MIAMWVKGCLVKLVIGISIPLEVEFFTAGCKGFHCKHPLSITFLSTRYD